jgi:hypothetical protein
MYTTAASVENNYGKKDGFFFFTFLFFSFIYLFLFYFITFLIYEFFIYKRETIFSGRVLSFDGKFTWRYCRLLERVL